MTGQPPVTKARHAARVALAVLAIAIALLVRELRRVPPPAREARPPLTDMAARAPRFDPGPPPRITEPTAARSNAQTATATTPPAVPPRLMPDPAHPPQGTQPLALPAPPVPPDPRVAPPMTVDPWAQRGLAAP